MHADALLAAPHAARWCSLCLALPCTPRCRPPLPAFARPQLPRVGSRHLLRRRHVHGGDRLQGGQLASAAVRLLLCCAPAESGRGGRPSAFSAATAPAPGTWLSLPRFLLPTAPYLPIPLLSLSAAMRRSTWTSARTAPRSAPSPTTSAPAPPTFAWVRSQCCTAACGTPASRLPASQLRPPPASPLSAPHPPPIRSPPPPHTHPPHPTHTLPPASRRQGHAVRRWHRLLDLVLPGHGRLPLRLALAGVSAGRLGPRL